MIDALAPFSLEVDQPAIDAYAVITNDFNPLHVDPVFAATTPMGGVIAHGTMSLSLIWRSIAESFGPEAAARAILDVRFLRPVRPGDTVSSGGSPRDDISYTVWVKNQHGEAVIEGTLSFRNP